MRKIFSVLILSVDSDWGGREVRPRIPNPLVLARK